MKMIMKQHLKQKVQSIDPARFGRVAVLCGGNSAERDISLDSGKNILKALLAAGVDSFALDPRYGVSTLANKTFDRAFIALHGRGGEDGSIQGVLELMGIPYTGSGVLASALAMNKLMAKQVWDAQGIATSPYRVPSQDADWKEVMSYFDGPAMVKPAHEGSSFGMSRVTNHTELASAYKEASLYDALVFVEKWIAGSEYTVAILDNTPLPVIGVKPQGKYYDYYAKYVADDNQFLLPCGLSEALESAVKDQALKAYHALGCRGWGRVDIILDSAGQPWVLEINSVPGMNQESLMPMAAEAAGLNYQNLVLSILSSTLHESETGYQESTMLKTSLKMVSQAV